MSKKSEIQKGIENIKDLLELYATTPDAVIVMERDYYDLERFVEAYRDIQLRKSLGAETKADILLLSIMAFSLRSYY